MQCKQSFSVSESALKKYIDPKDFDSLVSEHEKSKSPDLGSPLQSPQVKVDSDKEDTRATSPDDDILDIVMKETNVEAVFNQVLSGENGEHIREQNSQGY